MATVLAMYDHRPWKARDPVCSPIDKPETASLVVGWVTTSESLVLYNFFSLVYSYYIQDLRIFMATVLAMYDHRPWKARDPVCSPIDKPETASLVVGWVTTSEYLVLYACFFLSFLS